MSKRLGAKSMKVLKFFHVWFAMFWMGALAGMWALSYWPAQSGDELYMLLCAIARLDNWVLIPGAMSIYVTAIIYGVMTGFGFFKLRWLTVKWILALLLTLVGTFYFHPNLLAAIDIVDAGRDAAMNDPQVLHAVKLSRYCSIQFIILTVVVIISVFKPWKKR